jgi:hypothetical protein
MQDQNLPQKIGFLQESPGNNSSRRLIEIWLLALITGTFIKAWLGFPVGKGLVELTVSIAWVLAVSLVGGKGMEKMPEIISKIKSKFGNGQT